MYQFRMICSFVLLGFLFVNGEGAEELLVAWESGTVSPSAAGIPGLDVTLNAGTSTTDTGGSDDGTYGSFGSGAMITPASFQLKNSVQLTLTLVNNTAENLTLEAIRFDFVRRWIGSPADLLVTYDSGDLGAGPVSLFQTTSIATTAFDSGDYPDYDVLLSGNLADTQLAPGETAVFSILADNASGTAKSMLDNLALTGSAVAPLPEVPLLGWTSGLGSPDVSTSLVSATVSVAGFGGVNSLQGSTDGSYGSAEAMAPDTGGSFELFDGDSLAIAITNQSAGTLRIDQLNLDFNRRLTGSPADVSVAYESGDLNDGATALNALIGQGVVASNLADYADLNCELRRYLTDIELDQGESALFRVNVAGASGTDAAYVDNIGLFGELIPYEAPPPVTLPTVAASRRPNVVIFYADDIGLGDVSAYGYGGMITTPNIDALASQGMMFRNAHTVYGTCAPSRYGILSGNLALRGSNFNGTWQPHQHSQFLAGQKSLGDLFKEAGYHTSLFGKLHLGGQFYLNGGSLLENESFSVDLSNVDWLSGFHYGPKGYGFDYTFFSHDGVQDPPYMYHENDVPIDDLVYNLAAKKWTWITATNQPYLFLQKTNTLAAGYISEDPDGDGVFGSLSVDEGNNDCFGYAYWDSTHTGEMYTQAARNFIDDHVADNPDQPFFMHFCSQCVHVPHTPDTFFEEPVEGTELTAHLDMVHEMDLQVKALVDKLKEHGLENDTLIIYTSDNGGITKSTSVGHMPSGPFRGSKGDTWEGGHRVPFIIRWGDGTAASSVVPPATVCERVISQTDLFSTFATLLDRPQDATQGLDGMNILPYFMGQFTPVIRDHLIAARTDYAFLLGGWKIIATCQASAPYAPIAVTEMYHLATDPYETTDLSGNPAYAAMQAMLFAELGAKVTASRSTTALDSDADGLFDEWERNVAGNLSTYDAALLSSVADGDGDGVTDSDEYALRSNPAIADATTLESNVAKGQLQMAWPSASGRFYQMEHRENLITGHWDRLPATYIGNGENLQTEASLTSTNGFVRMVIE